MGCRMGAALLVMGLSICNGAMAETGASAALELGYRMDNLEWNIAGDGHGQNPNILSELKWTDMVSYQRRVKVDLHSNALHLLGSLAHGQVESGDNQDSDYLLDDRQGEFSRSNNQAGGAVTDLGIGTGYRFAVATTQGHKSYVMPMAGIALHRQALTMSNGNQTLSTAGETPPLGPIPGLNSSYDARWRGGWLGVSFIGEDEPGDWRLVLDIAYHLMQYRAEADWNLREDFRHPVSFAHRANGDGLTVSLNSVRRLSRSLDWLVGLDYGHWRTAHGVDTVYLANGSTAQTRLNRVKWESLAINLGLALRL